MPERIESLQERVDFILALDQRGVTLTEAEQDLLQRYGRHVQLQDDRERARQHAQVAVPGRRSGPPHPRPGTAPLSPVGSRAAVFDGRSGSGADYRARVAQLGLTMPVDSEDRISPPRPRLSPVLVESQRRLEVEQDAKRAAAAEKLNAGAIDGRSASAKDVVGRMLSLGIEHALVGGIRDGGQPLKAPQYASGRRGR